MNHENYQQKIRSDFDRIALYDIEMWNHNNHYHSFLLDQLPSKGDIALDIGCGTGAFSRLLAKRFERVIALDLSPNAIEIARQRSQDYRNIDYQVADIEMWKLPLEKFDSIVSIATLHHLSVENLLPDLKAALKPGGKLVVLDLLKYESIKDYVSDLIAVPLNKLFLLQNRHIARPLEAIEVMKEHLRTDEFLTLSQVKQIYLNSLDKAKIRKHLFWRYSVVWQKQLSENKSN